MSATDDELIHAYFLGLGTGYASALHNHGATDALARTEANKVMVSAVDDPIVRQQVLDGLRGGAQPDKTSLGGQS